MSTPQVKTTLSCEDVQRAVGGWKAAFNAGNALACAAYYEDNAVMTALPFGTFTGGAAIQAFWANLVAGGYSDIAYIEPEFVQVSPTEVHVKSKWTMNKAHGVITKEVWILQADGSARLRTDNFEVLG